MNTKEKALILEAIEQEIQDRMLNSGSMYVSAPLDVIEKFAIERKALHLAYRIVADYDRYLESKQPSLPRFHRKGESI